MVHPAAPALRRVHPDRAEPISVVDAYGAYGAFGATRSRRGSAGADRPWVSVCMISSLDGSVTVEGTSGGLGNTNDREILLTLRELADVVVVGAATARGEGYGAPQTGVRIGVVTNSGRLDVTSDLFRSGAGFVITSEATQLDGDVDVLRVGDSRVDLGAALCRLDELVPRVDRVHVEGGPTLNASLLELDLVDELDLTIAPMMVGGAGTRVALGAVEVVHRFDLVHLLVDDDGYTFGRWIRRARDGNVS